MTFMYKIMMMTFPLHCAVQILAIAGLRFLQNVSNCKRVPLVTCNYLLNTYATCSESSGVLHLQSTFWVQFWTERKTSFALKAPTGHPTLIGRICQYEQEHY